MMAMHGMDTGCAEMRWLKTTIGGGSTLVEYPGRFPSVRDLVQLQTYRLDFDLL